MRTAPIRTLLVAAITAALACPGAAQAQWVTLARRAIGRVEQLTQSQGKDGVSYDSAAVMLEAPADRVWATVVRNLHDRGQQLKITQEDPVARVVQFTNGSQIAGIRVSALGDNLTHLLVSSARTGEEHSASALVVNRVLQICAQMQLACEVAAKSR